MPLYEFQCGTCGERFEALAAVGTDEHSCKACGAEGTQRVLSEPAPLPKLVKSAAGNRRQEAKNRQLRETTKSDFKAKRQRAREAAKGRGSS